MRWKPHVRFGGRTGETGQHERLALRPGPTPTRRDCQPPVGLLACKEVSSAAAPMDVGYDSRTVAHSVGRRRPTVSAAPVRTSFDAIRRRHTSAAKFPGCAHTFVDIHHVKPWEHGGPTDVVNGCL